MTTSNYDRMRDQMEREFLNYDQEKMIRKYGLAYDTAYLYLTFVGRKCRVSRDSGRVEWMEDDFRHAVHADYNVSMTIFDVLCYAKDDCFLSGRFMPVNQLKGTVQSASPGKDLFGGAAKKFDGHGGGNSGDSGDHSSGNEDNGGGNSGDNGNNGGGGSTNPGNGNTTPQPSVTQPTDTNTNPGNETAPGTGTTPVNPGSGNMAGPGTAPGSGAGTSEEGTEQPFIIPRLKTIISVVRYPDITR